MGDPTAAAAAAATVVAQADPIGIADYFMTQGILGVLCAVLGYEVLRLRKQVSDQATAHDAKIAAKDALINELQEARLDEARQGFQIAKSATTSIDALVAATMRGRGR